MEQRYHLRALYLGETPFPYSFENKISEQPSCGCEGEQEGKSERLLTQEEISKLNRVLHSTEKLTSSNTDVQLVTSGFHIHDHCQITECLSGSLMYVVGRTAVLLLPGDVLIINELIPHAWAALVEGTTWRLLGFYPHTLSANTYSQRLMPYFSMIFDQHIPYIHIKSDFPGYENIIRILDQINEVDKTRPFAFDAVIHDALFSISLYLFYALNASLPISIRTSDEIEHIMRYIDQNINGDLSLKTMAQEANMNPSYFSTYFKKHLGVSYKKYVTTRKVAKAADLLRYSQLSVTQILFDCGFSSVSAFYNAFNSVYMVSPLEFRRIQPVNMRSTCMSTESILSDSKSRDRELAATKRISID